MITRQPASLTADALPDPAQCAPATALGLRLLAGLKHWSRDQPWVSGTPTAAMAMATAMISPWRPFEELLPVARICAWTYALDDFTEQGSLSEQQLEDMLRRCSNIVATGVPDAGHPLLGGLSQIQQELAQTPLHPELHDLWARKFDRCLDGMRYDWHAGRARLHGSAADLTVEDYLAHKDSILMWITHLPRWITSPETSLPRHLPALLPAFEDFATAVRLANDLASFNWEAAEPGQNNILMYGVSHDWVRAQRDAHLAAGRGRLAPLLAANYPPAVEALRCAEWGVSFYALADFRDSTVALPSASTPPQEQAAGPPPSPRGY